MADVNIVQTGDGLGDEDDTGVTVYVEYPHRNSMNNGDKDSMTITFYDNAGQTVASYVINIERVNSDVQLTFAYSIGSDYGGENFQWTNTDAYDDKLYTGQINSVSL